MVCCIKRHFDAQRFDSAGRNAVRLQKCLILLTMHAFVFFFLSVMGCPIFSTVVLLLSLSLITVGYAGARRRHVGLLRTYNALVTFVFVFVATFLFLSILLGGAAAVAAGASSNEGDEVEYPADEVMPYDESSPSIVPVSAQRALHASMRAVMPRVPSMVRPHLSSSLRTLRITAPTAVVSRMQAPMPAARAVLGRHGHHGHHNHDNEGSNEQGDGQTSPTTDDVLPMDDVLPPGAIPADAVVPAQEANAAFVGAIVASIVVIVLFVVIAVMAFLFLFIMPLVVVLLSLFFSGVTIFHLKKLRSAGVCSGACELPTVMPVAMPMMEPAAVRSEKGSPDAPYTPVYMPVSMQMFPPANGMAANPYSGVVYVPVTTYPGAQQ